jgi:eukaryotic-like serine/threonine-protein kinase
MIQPQALVRGRYRVGRRLGEGGMAVVYLGHDLLLGRDVAIKSPRPQFSADPGFRARFEREARAAASLSHPNIIDVYDVGEDDGTPFIVMELVRGQSLKAIIAADAPFHPDDVAELLEQIGGALDYAHARGYVHRDIKPGNILDD